MDKKIKIDFDASGLREIINDLKAVKKTAGDVKMSSRATKQINETTERIEQLEQEIQRLDKQKISVTQFEEYSKTIRGLVDGITQSFKDLKAAFEDIGKIDGLESSIKQIDDICKKQEERTQSVISNIDRMNKAVEKQSVSKPLSQKQDKVSKAQLNATQQVLDTTEAISRQQDTNIKKTQQENEELAKQANLIEEVNKKKAQGTKKKVDNVDANIENPTIRLELPKDTEESLKAEITQILDTIQATIKPINVEIAFTTNYKTRKKAEFIESINKQLDEAMKTETVTVEQRQALVDSITSIRWALKKELDRDDSATMLQFSTNIKEISQQIKTELKALSDAVGKIPLYADVHLDPVQIKEELKKVKDLSLTISNFDFGPDFLDTVANVDKLLEKKKELETPEEGAIVSEEEQTQADKFIEKALKLKKMLGQISGQLKTIEISGEFNKEQLQEALDIIDGLSIKIDSIDLSRVSKTLGPIGNIPVIVGGVAGGAGGSFGSFENQNAIDKELVNNEKALSNETEVVNTELQEFVQRVDKAAESLLFNEKGLIKQTKENAKAFNDFVKGFREPKPGHTLLDWAMNTDKLGVGQTLIDNIQILQGGLWDYKNKTRKGGLTGYARVNKYATPQEIASRLTAVDESGNLLYLNKTGGTKHLVKDKNGTVLKDDQGNEIYKITPYLKKEAEVIVDELFKAMVMYGVNIDPKNSISSVMPKDMPLGFQREIEGRFREQYPAYGQLLQVTQLPTTPQKKKPNKKILDESLALLPATRDDFMDLDADISQYLKLQKLNIDRLDKTLQEALEEVQSVDDFLKLGSQYSEQKKTKAERQTLLTSIMHRLTQLSPNEYEQLMALQGPTGKFMAGLEKYSPETWEKIQSKRASAINESLKSRISRIQRDEEGSFALTEKNEEYIDQLVDYLLKTFPDMRPRAGEYSFKAIGEKYGLDKKSLAIVKDKYQGAKLDEQASEYLNSLSKSHDLWNMTDEELKKLGEEMGASAEVITHMSSKLSEIKEAIEEARKKQAELAEAEKNKKQPRVKTDKERQREHQASVQKPETPTQARQAQEVTLRSGYEEEYYKIQNAVQKASIGIDRGYLEEDSIESIQKILEKYYDKLLDIQKLKERIEFIKDKIKEETGQELTTEELLKEVYPASPENVSSALSAMKNYDRFFAEAEALIEKSNDIVKKAQAKAEVVVDESRVPFVFNDEQVQMLQGKIEAIKTTEKGGYSTQKGNAASVKDLVNTIKSIVEKETFDVADLRDQISVPGVEKFIAKEREERAVNRKLTQEFEQIASQMAKFDEKGKETEEYKALSASAEKLNQQLKESSERQTANIGARQAYEDAFWGNVQGSYDKTYQKSKKVGESVPEGYVDAIKENESEVTKTTAEMVREGIEAARKAQYSHSPSKEYYRLGMWAIEGYVDAIKENLPLIKEFASQIKFNPDGSVADEASKNKANQFINTLKSDWGALRVARKSPLADLVDDKGVVQSKGLKTLLGELNRTEKTGQISKKNDFSQFFDSFVDAYGVQSKNKKIDTSTLKTVLKQMQVGDKDIAILEERFHDYLKTRSKNIENERARLKTIVDNLARNKNTINKRKSANGTAFSELQKGYIENYKNAYNKNGVVDKTFDKFAKDMGLEGDDKSRVKDVLNDITRQMYADIDNVRQECVQAAEAVKNKVASDIKDNDELESNVIAENKQESIAATEAESKAKEQAIKEEAKRRKKLIADIQKIVENESGYLPSFREQGRELLGRLNNGGGLDEGDLYKAQAKNYRTVTDKDYYNALRRANRLASSYIADSDIKQRAREIAVALEDMGDASKRSAQEFEELRSQLGSLEASAEKAGKTFYSQIIQRLQKANADFFARYFSIYDIIRYFREFTQTVTEYDTALTEMRKVSDESTASLREYQRATFDVANALGTTAVQLQQSTADWLRLGESMDEASKSAVAATTLFNVSEFENIGDATQALVAMSQAYKDVDKTEIVDVLNNIGNNYAIATDELATALQASSAALMTQGNDLYEAAALVTAGNQIIQDASKTGTGIRTIALRIAGQKMDKEELEKELNELGEEVDEWVMQTESKKREVIMEYTKVASNDHLGVDILDPNGNLKDTYHILLEIAKVYKEIQEEDKRYGTNRAQGLVEELAGKVRSNIAASILTNPEVLENVYNSALNSAGSAAEENAKYLDSIVGKTEQLKNEFQEFQTLILNSDLLKFLLDIGRFALNIVNQLISKVPNLTSLVIMLGAAFLSTSKDVFFATDGMSKIQLLWSGLTSILKQYTGVQNQATVATEAGTVAIEAQTKANIAAAAATKAKNAIISMVITGVIILLTKAITHIITYRKEVERTASESRDAIKEINSNLQNSTKTVDEVSQRYAQLAQRVSDLGKATQGQGSLSTEEYKEFLDISNQLSEIFPQLTKGYDDNGNAILRLNGEVHTITESLKDLVDAQRMLASEEILSKAEDIFKDDAEKYKKAIKEREKFEKEYLDREKEFSSFRTAISNNSQYVDYNDASTMMYDIFGDRAYDVMNKVQTDAGWNWNALSDFEIAQIDAYWENITAEYLKQQQKSNNEIESINADFRKYMNIYATTMLDNDLDRSLASSLAEAFNYGDLPNDVRKNWDKIKDTINQDLISAIEGIDSQELKEKMIDVLEDAQITPQDKLSMIDSILSELPYDEQHPLVLYFKMQETNLQQDLQNSIDHIVSGMTPQGTEDRSRMRARAESYINQLTEEERKALNNVSIAPETINSLEDVYELLQVVKLESDSTYKSISALLSQDNPIKKWDREKLDPDKAEQLYKLYDEELKKAEEAGADLERTVYGNIDLNDRARLDWDESLLDKYRDEVESWYKLGNDYAGAFDKAYEEAFSKYEGLPIPESAKEDMARKDADVYATNFVNEFASQMANNYLGSTSTVVGSYDDKAFGGIGIAYSPLLQVDGKAVPLNRDTIVKYFDELNKQLTSQGLKVNKENILAIDAKGLEVDGKKIQKLIADVGETAEVTSRTMHYLGTDGALGLVQQMIDEVEYSAPTWEQVREDLIGMAQSGKLDEKTFRDYKYFNDIIKALGLTADVTDEELKSMIDDINKMATINATDRLSTAKTELDKLDNAYKQFKTKGAVDATALNEVQDAFAYLGESYREFEEAVMTGQEDLQPYFDEMVTQYAIQEGLLQNVTEETKEWTVANLVNAGVSQKSAQESVDALLQNKRVLEEEILLDAKKLNTLADLDNETRQYLEGLTDLDDLDEQNIANLINETNATFGLSEELKEAARNLGIFALQKAFAEGKDLRNPDDLQYLWELIQACGLGAEALAEFEAAKVRATQLDISQKEVQNNISNYEAQMKQKYGNTDSSKWDYNDQSYYRTLLGQQKNIDKQRDENAEYIANWASNLASDYGASIMEETYDEWSKMDPAQDTKLKYGGAVEDASKAGADAAKEFKETLDKILAMYDAELDAGVETFKNYVNKSRAIIEQYYQEGKITASEYYDYIANLYEKQVSEYDKVISAVQRKIKEQIDSLDKEKESIEESYNLQIEEIQKKIDALQEENDEIDRNMALSRAQ